MEFEESFCFIESEFDTIWSNEYLYKKENWKIKPLEIADDDFDIPF